jgi:NitT/TauT family transport system ATP-binding protein
MEPAAQIPAGASPLLSVKNLVVTYENPQTGERTAAVDRVSLDIQQGEFVTIVGLSGCGKSTFLLSVAGLVPHQGGSINLQGRPIAGPGQDRTLVFQKASLLPWRTVLGNITYGLDLRGEPRRQSQAKAREAIKLVRLEGFEHVHPRALSGGMQQRANLARALVCDPALLLMDEPFSALDAITRENLQNELLGIWDATRKTVLMVTHQIDEAVLLSDRILIFSDRPARLAGEVKVALPRPRSASVKSDPRFARLVERVWAHINAKGEPPEVEYGI